MPPCPPSSGPHGSESGAISLSSAARHIDFHLLRRVFMSPLQRIPQRFHYTCVSSRPREEWLCPGPQRARHTAGGNHNAAVVFPRRTVVFPRRPQLERPNLQLERPQLERRTLQSSTRDLHRFHRRKQSRACTQQDAITCNTLTLLSLLGIFQSNDLHKC